MVYRGIYDKVVRESKTEKKVREMDAHEIVEWIHTLEDKIENLEDENYSLNLDVEFLKGDLKNAKA